MWSRLVHSGPGRWGWRVGGAPERGQDWQTQPRAMAPSPVAEQNRLAIASWLACGCGHTSHVSVAMVRAVSSSRDACSRSRTSAEVVMGSRSVDEVMAERPDSTAERRDSGKSVPAPQRGQRTKTNRQPNTTPGTADGPMTPSGDARIALGTRSLGDARTRRWIRTPRVDGRGKAPAVPRGASWKPQFSGGGSGGPAVDSRGWLVILGPPCKR